MPAGLQIGFRLKTCFIHAVYKDHINRTTFGWEIRTLYCCEFYVLLRSWIVRFWCSNLPTFIPYFKSILFEKIAILRLGISIIKIRSHLVKYYQYLTRVTYSNFEEMCLYFGSLHLILSLMLFKSISNDKLAIFLLGIRTI
jgi:hypothetical protein